MTNNDILLKAFVTILEIEASKIDDDLKYQSIAEWDSINHMFLINEIESVFNIEIDSEDILYFKSFKETKVALSKYNVTF
ncbi:acyl carrier protein [Gelidibacter salicanalis]|uniref:Acyl carrier protein n=1 Tax=Gelidibacter salicanalis TaxID=291193 RepID=A0A934KY42_9FLAO|nr:acyl carrier protein [Gelidibacter salicanalis]MBJ7882702.1 acyl carrier protein [Gelidibacter salicanalis]